MVDKLIEDLDPITRAQIDAANDYRVVHDNSDNAAKRISVRDDELGIFNLFSGTTVAKTTGYTVLVGDNGTTFTNNGASSTLTFTLPPSLAVNDLRYAFVNYSSQYYIRLDPASGTETIGPLTGKGGKYYELISWGSRVVVRCYQDNLWSIEVETGLTRYEP